MRGNKGKVGTDVVIMLVCPWHRVLEGCIVGLVLLVLRLLPTGRHYCVGEGDGKGRERREGRKIVWRQNKTAI